MNAAREASRAFGFYRRPLVVIRQRSAWSDMPIRYANAWAAGDTVV